MKNFMEYMERAIYGLYKPGSSVGQYGWKLASTESLLKISHIKFYENLVKQFMWSIQKEIELVK
jgi:hypothetical protein